MDAGSCHALLERVALHCARIARLPGSLMEREAWLALHRHPERYEPNEWFSLFTRLRMESGWRLDFVYRTDGNSGRPILYARPETGARFESAEELLSRCAPEDWQRRVASDATEQGWFERVVFARVASRFHLVWHSFAGQAEFICDRVALAERLAASAEPTAGRLSPPRVLECSRAEALARAEPHLAPVVEMDANGAALELLSWQMPGGLSLQRYRVRAGEPVALENETMLCRTFGGLVA